MYYLGVDLGATNVRAVVGDQTATIRGSARDRTPEGTTGTAVTEAVLGVVREACEAAAVEPTAIEAGGIAAMGLLDTAAGVVREAANLADDIDQIPLVEPLTEELQTEEIYLCSDTLAGAIGERFFAHPDVDDLAYLTISSGIGAGVIADDEPFSGRDGNAGEVGHMTIDADGTMTCGCGRTGHWEAYCSGKKIPEFARALHEGDPDDTAVPLDSPGFTAPDLFEHAGEDAFADSVIERLAELNTVGLANVVYAYTPSVVSIGGAVALNNPDLVVGAIRDRIDEAVLVDTPEISTSELGEQAVLKGALASALTDGTGDPSHI